MCLGTCSTASLSWLMGDNFSLSRICLGIRRSDCFSRAWAIIRLCWCDSSSLLRTPCCNIFLCHIWLHLHFGFSFHFHLHYLFPAMHTLVDKKLREIGFYNFRNDMYYYYQGWAVRVSRQAIRLLWFVRVDCNRSDWTLFIPQQLVLLLHSGYWAMLHHISCRCSGKTLIRAGRCLTFGFYLQTMSANMRALFGHRSERLIPSDRAMICIGCNLLHKSIPGHSHNATFHFWALRGAYSLIRFSNLTASSSLHGGM